MGLKSQLVIHKSRDRGEALATRLTSFHKLYLEKYIYGNYLNLRKKTCTWNKFISERFLTK